MSNVKKAVFVVPCTGNVQAVFCDRDSRSLYVSGLVVAWKIKHAEHFNFNGELTNEHDEVEPIVAECGFRPNVVDCEDYFGVLVDGTCYCGAYEPGPLGKLQAAWLKDLAP